MSRWGLKIDLDGCTGCGACIAACAQENNVPVGHPETAEARLIRWMEIIPITTGEYPDVRVRMTPFPCQQCDNAPCVKVCPVQATYRNPEGLIPQVYPRCIGCRYCVNACPYTCKTFNFDDPVWPEPMERGLNPDVSVRTRGVTEKCNFCLHRLQVARDVAAIAGKPMNPDAYVTACQSVCPTKAIKIGDLDDPRSELAEAERESRAMRMFEELGTEPKVIYLKEKS